MTEVTGNIWDYHKKGHWIVITTNGFVKKNGAAVMGRGIAKQAKDRFKGIEFYLGNHIKEKGNIPCIIEEFRIMTLPVKSNWWQKADLDLIEQSMKRLITIISAFVLRGAIEKFPAPIYLVRPGCGNGGLDWKDVKPVIEAYLDNRFTVVNRELKRQIMNK